MRTLPAQGKLGFRFKQKYPASFGSLAGKPHLGLDILCPVGTPIKAPCDGVIYLLRGSAHGNELGLTIILKSTDGLYHRLGHNSAYQCKQGQQVVAGAQVGLSGNTGTATTAAHCHYDISRKLDSKNIDDYIDPELYIKQQGEDMNWGQANGILYAITGNTNNPDAQVLADAANLGNQGAETAIIQKAIRENYLPIGSDLAGYTLIKK